MYQCLTLSAQKPAEWGPDAGVKRGGGRNGRACLLPESGGLPPCAESRGNGPFMSSARWDLDVVGIFA